MYSVLFNLVVENSSNLNCLLRADNIIALLVQDVASGLSDKTITDSGAGLLSAAIELLLHVCDACPSNHELLQMTPPYSTDVTVLQMLGVVARKGSSSAGSARKVSDVQSAKAQSLVARQRRP
jgi:hypothetical protein